MISLLHYRQTSVQRTSKVSKTYGKYLVFVYVFEITCAIEIIGRILRNSKYNQL